MHFSRRKFLRKSLTSAAGLAAINVFPEGMPFGNLHKTSYPEEIILRPATGTNPKESIRFSVIGLNHDHIYGMAGAIINGGGKLVSVYAREPELLKPFTKRFPGVRIAESEKEILEDPSVQLVASASIPADRAPLGIRVMKSGKDFMADKPGIVTLNQLDEVRKVQKSSGRIYSIMYSERLGNPASVQAGKLIEAGAIGQVVQTIGLGPHRMRPASRPEWFFDPGKAGGILCDIGSHQCDQFLFYTGSKQAEVSFAQTGNFANGKYPLFQDLAI